MHTYRDRLRLEGSVLAACGAAGALALLVLVEESRDRPLATVGQLALVALFLAVLGPRAVRRWAAEAPPVDGRDAGDGEPTPLWHLPLVGVALGAVVWLPGEAWDAALRVAGGCVLVGLAQAVVLERTAAAEERRRGGTLVRLPGSRLVRGTRLGLLRG